MKRICGIVFASVLLSANTYAVKVVSGSKYPIVIELYKWSSSCEKKARSELKNIGNAAEKAKNNVGLSAAIKETFRGVISGSGCDKIGKAFILKPGKDTNLPAGALMVAYKDPVLAHKKNKKVVNPMPAIKKIPDSGTVTLKTRKSSTLGALIGMKGDGGLKAVVKK